jgi:hypothetical protein
VNNQPREDRATFRDEIMKGQTTERCIDLATANGATELEARIQCRLGRQIREFRLVVVDGG